MYRSCQRLAAFLQLLTGGIQNSFGTILAADNTLDIPNNGSKAAWEEFVAKVNNSLDNLDLEFRHLNDETTGRVMYALVRPINFSKLLKERPH